MSLYFKYEVKGEMASPILNLIVEQNVRYESMQFGSHLVTLCTSVLFPTHS